MPHDKNYWLRMAVKEPCDVFIFYPHFAKESYAAEVLKKAAYVAAEKDPSAAFSWYHRYENKPYAAEVLKKAAYAVVETEPSDALEYFEIYANKPYAAEVLKKAAYAAANKDPDGAFTWFETYAKEPYAVEVLKKAAYTAANKYPEYALLHFECYAKQPYAEAILKKAAYVTAEINPRSALTHYDTYAKKTYGATVLKKAAFATAERDPMAALAYFDSYAKEPYAAEVKSIAQATNTVQHLNYLHDQPAPKRFALLKDKSPAQVYDLIVYGRAEAYTSTYHGLAKDLADKLSKQGKNLTDPGVLNARQMARMGVFLEAAATYNRTDAMLRFIAPSKLPVIIDQLATQAGSDKDLRFMATFNSMMVGLKENPPLRRLLEQEIYDRYTHEKSAGAKNRFGLLAASYSTNAGKQMSPNMPDKEKAFYLGIASNHEYKQPATVMIPKAALLDKQGSCNQLMVFAGDDDAKASFNNWKASYCSSSARAQGWRIEEKASYTHIYNTSGKVPVHVYANHPAEEENAAQALKHIHREVAKRQGSANAAFQVFIGRGHSYHAPEYIEKITPSMKLVHLGSCGGFGNVSRVLEKSPDAQISSTKETGKMGINDPLLLHQNNSIVRGEGINWATEQKYLDTLGDGSDGYVLPHRNINVALLKRHKALQSEKAQLDKLGIHNVKELEAYIEERASVGIFPLSNGTIEKDEFNKIIKAARLLGQSAIVTQNSGDNDVISLPNTPNKIKIPLTLDPSIKPGRY